MAKTFYAWSDIYMGGESKEMKDGRRVILKRNVIACGEKVTAQKLGLEKDEFEELQRKGVVRDYPLPEGSSTFLGSPVEFVREQIAAMQEEAEEQGNAENELLLRSYVTGSLFALPDDHAEVPLPPGVEEVK